MHKLIVSLIIACVLLCGNLSAILPAVKLNANFNFLSVTNPFNVYPLPDSTVPPPLQNLPYATYPSDAGYNTFRFNYNRRFNIFPKAIFAPTSEVELQYVLGLLKFYKLEFAVRSGGHCFESASLSSNYIIDLKNFNSIIPDLVSETVYLGAGCRLNNVIQTIGALNYAIPTGTCPTVGVTGLTLGGGIGLLVRQYGLTCDSLESITLLNAQNQIIEVNKNSHPDLFWALKGAGNGSFGIVIGLTFKMHYIPISSFYELLWTWDSSTAPTIINSWQKWVSTLPSNISSSIRLEYKEGAVGIKIIGIKVGDEPFTEWIRPFEHLVPSVRIFQGAYSTNSQYWASEPTIPFNKSKSKILFKPISKKGIRKIVKYMNYLKKNQFNLRVFLNFDAFGGNIPNFDNSFAFRNAYGWWYQAIYWPLQTQGGLADCLINKIYHSTKKYVSKYSYANVPDYELGDDYMKIYYGPYVKQLVRIKNQYDPENLFHWKQSIPLKYKS